MTLDKFVITYKVGKSYDYAGGYKGECVSLVKRYIRDVLGFTPQSIGNAKEYWLKRNGSYIKAHFKPVSKPKRGDLFVRTSGTYGHIGIVLSAGDTNYYTIEQNKGGCRVVTNELRKYGSGYYFLRPLHQANIGADRTLHTPTDEAVYFKAYKGTSDSLVDALEAVGAKSDFAYRKKIAQKNKITNYKGTSEQNGKLLALLKKGKLIKP